MSSALVRYSLVTPKRPGGHLLDRSSARCRVVAGARVLAALAGVRLAAEAVHRDGQGLVGLMRDRAVAHRPGREPLDDLADRLDLVERDRRASPAVSSNRPRRVASRFGLVVDERVYSLKMS
jgi:hypothetical protein